jgi:phosphoribosyl 1,2-cyclic phosphodiesterase
MRATFWGVRGSVPWAGRSVVRYGPNTPCIELSDSSSGMRLVLDAGTGIVGVGEALEAGPRRVPILLTHYHWDHVQGLPFFDPVYQAGWSLAIWGPTFESSDASHIKRIFRRPFFSRDFEELASPPDIHSITAGEHSIDGVEVSAMALHHPGGALAYKIRGETGALVYATDHEFGVAPIDSQLAAFARGAAALVLDAHFTPEEEPGVKGWGHSTWARAAEFAAATGVGRLWLFHHKPGRSDVELDRIVECARAVFPATHAAAEGSGLDF